MAALCEGPAAGRRRHGLPDARTGLEGSLLAPLGDRYQSGGLPCLSHRAQGTWLFAKHHQDGLSVASCLSAMAVRRGSARAMVAASFTATGSMVDEAGSKQDCGRGEVATRQTIPNPWAGNRSARRCNLGPHLGSRGLPSRDNRLPPRWQGADQQAPHRCADEQSRAGSTRGSATRRAIGSCDRVWRQAGGFDQEGNPAPISSNRHSGKPARPTPHLRSMDGTGRCADAENIAVSWAHFACHDSQRLRQVFAVIYDRCRGRCGVLMYNGTSAVFRPVPENPGILVPLRGFEPLTPSLRMMCSTD